MLYRGLQLGFFGWLGLLFPSLAIAAPVAAGWYYFVCPYFGFGNLAAGISSLVLMLGVKTAVRELIVGLAFAARNVSSTGLRLVLRLVEAAIICAPIAVATIWLIHHVPAGDTQTSATVLGALIAAAALASTTVAFMEFDG